MASVRSLLKKTVVRVIAFAFMVSIGSIVFSVVERPNAEDVLKTKEKTLESLQKEMEVKYRMKKEDFENFSKRSHEALGLGGPEWDYVDGLRFAFETLTTIGYGAIAPSTSVGQGLCMVFALLGIPVTILAFQSVGELMSRGISSLIAGTERLCCGREPSHVEAKCAAVTCILMLIMLLCGGVLQRVTGTEDWSFLVGLYFWFITFTTIGYGDYVPEIDKSHVSPARVTMQLVWTTLGLCVVSSVLNALATFIEKRREKCKPRCCGCLGNRESKDLERYEKNEKQMYENHNSGNVSNGYRHVPRAHWNGNDRRKTENNYQSVTYV